MVEKIPVSSAQKFGKKHGLSRVLIIGVDDVNNTTHTVSWGDTKQNCGFAATDIQKIRAMLDAKPTSLAEAVAVASLIHPEDVEGF